MKKIDFSKFDERLFKGIAHRGYHDDKFTENGLLAFKKAIEHNLAFELDVHLTLDKKLVVCHDSELKRVTNKDGIIEELTLKEIKDEYRLLDGETLPTLEEVLSLNEERVPIVVELKPYKNNYKKLAKEVKKCLSSIKNKKSITLISFDPRALFPFCFKKEYTTGLLVCQNRLDTLFFRNRFSYLDVEISLLSNEKVISFAKKKPINAWTIRSLEDLAKVKDKTDMVTFELLKEENLKEVEDASRRWSK